MTKHNALHSVPGITIVLLIVTVVIFSSQAVFAQSGTAAGGHDEIVKRLQDKLASFKSESLSQEMGPILSETGEADLGAKLVESYLGSVGKINPAIKGVANVSDLSMQNIDKNMEALASVGDLLDEIDHKAILIQTYYDALSEDVRKTWSGTARQRMTNGSKPTIDALKALGVVCPANQMDQHNKMCFYSFEQIQKQLDNIRNLEQQLERAAEEMKKSRPGSNMNSFDGDMYPDMYPDGPPGMSPPGVSPDGMEGPGASPQRAAALTLVQQVEALAMGTATPEQVKPLCDLLASTMDGLLANNRYELNNKRNELAGQRQPVASRGGGMDHPFGPGSDMAGEYGLSAMDYGSGYPGSDSLVRTATAAPMPPVNVAGYIQSEIRYFVARNIKQLVVNANDANRDTLLKAWCAVCEVGSSWDVLPLVTAKVSPDSSAQNSAPRQGAPGSPGPPGGMPEPPLGPPDGMLGPPGGMPGPPGMSSSRNPASSQRNASMAKIEMLSVMSGYRSDLRVHYVAIGWSGDDPDLSIQMCFNLGKSVVPLIKMSLTSPLPPSQAKVALIEATQYIGDPDAAQFLLPLLTSTDRNIVSAAADAIAVIGDRRASASLVKGLENPRLAEIIVGILKRMGTTSSQDIIPMFKSANPVTDKFCVDILKDSGDINTLFFLAAILERYHNAPAKKDMPQAEKSELLMLTMEAGAAIISRNMGKASPTLTIPTLVAEAGKSRLDYDMPRGVLAGGDALGMGMPAGMGQMPGMPGGMGPGMAPGMPPGGMGAHPDGTGAGAMVPGMPPAMPGGNMALTSGVPGSPGTGGTTGTTTLVPLEQLLMQPEEIKNNAPFIWLDILYKVAAKHVDDTAKLMQDVKTDNSGKKIGTDIRNERVDREFFRTVINTSEEGLGAYMPGDKVTGEALKAYPISKSDVNKLKVQKDRVIRDFGVYQKELNRIGQRKASIDAFNEAMGKKTNASGTSTDGSGSGTTTPAATNPLGRRL